MRSLPGKIRTAFAAFFGLTTAPPAAIPTGVTPETVISLLKALVNLLTPVGITVVGTIEAPGAGTDLPVTLGGALFKNHIFTFTVATIDTDVVMGIVGKAKGEATFALVAQNNATITANGRFFVKIANTPLSDVGLRMVSESGGAAVVISAIEYRGSN